MRASEIIWYREDMERFRENKNAIVRQCNCNVTFGLSVSAYGQILRYRKDRVTGGSGYVSQSTEYDASIGTSFEVIRVERRVSPSNLSPHTIFPSRLIS